MTTIIYPIPSKSDMMYEKGMPVAVVQVGTHVDIWVRSATGDSSDSHTFTIPCHTEEQAKHIVENYKSLFGF